MTEMGEYRIKQDKQIVATVFGPAQSAEGEVLHYARQYLEGGDLAIEQKVNGRWRTYLKMKQGDDE